MSSDFRKLDFGGVIIEAFYFVKFHVKADKSTGYFTRHTASVSTLTRTQNLETERGVKSHHFQSMRMFPNLFPPFTPICNITYSVPL